MKYSLFGNGKMVNPLLLGLFQIISVSLDTCQYFVTCYENLVGNQQMVTVFFR